MYLKNERYLKGTLSTEIEYYRNTKKKKKKPQKKPQKTKPKNISKHCRYFQN